VLTVVANELWEGTLDAFFSIFSRFLSCWFKTVHNDVSAIAEVLEVVCELPKDQMLHDCASAVARTTSVSYGNNENLNALKTSSFLLICS
jgi:hypothetical protein